MKTNVQSGSNMTGIDLCVNKPHLVPVIFEPPSTFMIISFWIILRMRDASNFSQSIKTRILCSRTFFPVMVPFMR